MLLIRFRGYSQPVRFRKRLKLQFIQTHKVFLDHSCNNNNIRFSVLESKWNGYCWQTAARKRCRKHMMETDEFVSSSSESYLMDTITISTAYLKMKNLCVSIRNEIQADIKIHSQHMVHGQHIFPRYLATTSLQQLLFASWQSCKIAFQFITHDVCFLGYAYIPDPKSKGQGHFLYLFFFFYIGRLS